jgi:hypothetical protein
VVRMATAVEAVEPVDVAAMPRSQLNREHLATRYQPTWMSRATFPMRILLMHLSQPAVVRRDVVDPWRTSVGSRAAVLNRMRGQVVVAVRWTGTITQMTDLVGVVATSSNVRRGRHFGCGMVPSRGTSVVLGRTSQAGCFPLGFFCASMVRGC